MFRCTIGEQIPIHEHTTMCQSNTTNLYYIMFIAPCIIAIVQEWKTNLMSLAILFRFLCAQHVSDVNISIFRSLRLYWWITTSVVLFSVRCVWEFLLRLVFGGVRFAGFMLRHNKWNKIASDIKLVFHSSNLYYVYYCIRGTCFDSYRIIFRPF